VTRYPPDKITVYVCPRCLWRSLHFTDTCHCQAKTTVGAPHERRALTYVREQAGESARR